MTKVNQKTTVNYPGLDTTKINRVYTVQGGSQIIMFSRKFQNLIN